MVLLQSFDSVWDFIFRYVFYKLTYLLFIYFQELKMYLYQVCHGFWRFLDMYVKELRLKVHRPMKNLHLHLKVFSHTLW